MIHKFNFNFPSVYFSLWKRGLKHRKLQQITIWFLDAISVFSQGGVITVLASVTQLMGGGSEFSVISNTPLFSFFLDKIELASYKI